MTDVLICYGDDIRALADTAGDFDASSSEDAARWYRMQWARVSQALHWNRALPALDGDFASMEATALEAFDHAHRLDFRGAGDRSTRKCRSQEVRDVAVAS